MRLLLESTELQDPNVPVRWCLDPQERDWLNGKHLPSSGNPISPDDVKVVLVLTKKDVSGQHKQIFCSKPIPLDQRMEYVALPEPGALELHAILIRTFDSRNLQSILSRAPIIRPVSDESKNDWHHIEVCSTGSMLHKILAHVSQHISVPAECFAPEPPRWKKRWVNLWFEASLTNECHYRKRKILAYTLQPLIVGAALPVMALMRMVFALSLLSVGFKNVPVKAAWHPWAYKIYDIWAQREGPPRFFKKNSHEAQNPFIIALSPPVLLVLGFLIFLFTVFIEISWSDFLNALGFLGISFAIALIFCGIAYFFVNFSKGSLDRPHLWARLTSRKERKQKERSKRMAKERKARMLAIIQKNEELTCTAGKDLRPILSALPKEKRTIHLRYQALKGRVCKPFARFQ